MTDANQELSDRRGRIPVDHKAMLDSLKDLEASLDAADDAFIPDPNQELKDLEASLDDFRDDPMLEGLSAQDIETIRKSVQRKLAEAEPVIEGTAEHDAPFEVPKKETSAQMTKRWVKYGEEHLKNRTIKKVRYLTKNEASGLGWQSRVIVLELDNGTLLLPSSDDEGNDGGALFGNTKSGKELTFPVLWR